MIYKIIQELSKTRSRNDKEAILSREVDNVDLKNFFRLALNPFIKFYQKKTFNIQSTQDVEAQTLEYVMVWLESNISKRVYTGNNAIDKINSLLSTLTEVDQKTIMCILKKESGCDLGAATINKIWPKLIPTFPTLLATAYDEKLAEKLNWSDGVFSQCLSDEWVLSDGDIKYSIKDIVDNKLELKIKSYDPKNNKYCFNSIVGWFENGYKETGWVTITYEEDGIIKTSNHLTENHKIYVSGKGWIFASNLVAGDLLPDNI